MDSNNNFSVGTNNGFQIRPFLPIGMLFDRIPLRLRTVKRKARQLGTMVEGLETDARYATWNAKLRQARTAIKRPIINFRHAFGNDDIRQAFATANQIFSDARQVL